MQEQLIKFETAKLAKEKGFDANTYSNCWVKTLDGEIIHNSERRNIAAHDRCEQYLMQPTQSLLQKWLREKHNIHVNCHPLKWEDDRLISYAWTIRDFRNKGKYYSDDGSGFEGSLEEGLQEALKLIKL